MQFNLAPKLSPEEQSGHTYNDLKNGTLVSVGQLADDDYDTIFSKHAYYVFKNGKIIIKVKQNYNSWKLCYISIKNKFHTQDLNIIDYKCSNLLKSSFNKHSFLLTTTILPGVPVLQFLRYSTDMM